MWTNRVPKPTDGEPWGFDNGAFSAWCKGAAFPEGTFLRRLDAAMKIGTPYLAVAPDEVGKGMFSLTYSLEWMRRLPPWPWYLALQDGMTETAVAQAAPVFSGLFLGGTDKFKREAHQWSALAARLGKPFHYGRAGTPRKIRAALASGCDSFDSAFPLWTLERFDTFERCLMEGDPQHRFAFNTPGSDGD